MIQDSFTRLSPAKRANTSSISSAGRQHAFDNWIAALVCAASVALVPVTHAAENAELISVDFVVGGSGGDGSGHTAPCSGDTLLTGTTMNNAVGNVFTGQGGIGTP